jgi:hypothetical protein
MPAGRYAIDDHLRGKPPELVALFERLLTLVQESGPVELEPARVGVAFHGRRRIFGSAKVEPLTKRLYLHGYLIRADIDLDTSFRRLIAEAYDVGQGNNPRPSPGA